MENKAKQVLKRIEKERGVEIRPWQVALAGRDPDFLEGIHNLNMHALYRQDGLPRKYVELIQMVVNVLSFHEVGFRSHLGNALKVGLTEVEVLQALEICTLSGIHYASTMLSAFEDEVLKYKNSKG
jgi:alkylhydroperoxidase/carboxymuconolactone decarboxylase family protein YurZ